MSAGKYYNDIGAEIATNTLKVGYEQAKFAIQDYQLQHVRKKFIPQNFINNFAQNVLSAAEIQVSSQPKLGDENLLVSSGKAINILEGNIGKMIRANGFCSDAHEFTQHEERDKTSVRIYKLVSKFIIAIQMDAINETNNGLTSFIDDLSKEAGGIEMGDKKILHSALKMEYEALKADIKDTDLMKSKLKPEKLIGKFFASATAVTGAFVAAAFIASGKIIKTSSRYLANILPANASKDKATNSLGEGLGDLLIKNGYGFFNHSIKFKSENDTASNNPIRRSGSSS
jgi:hypothetical protein